MHDRITIGDAADTALGRTAAERVVQGVLDGTWPDIHSVLVHHKGQLIRLLLVARLVECGNTSGPATCGIQRRAW
jgi:hypothetical protein